MGIYQSLVCYKCKRWAPRPHHQEIYRHMPTPQKEQRLERKFTPFELKEVDLSESTFTGYSAAIGNMDLGNDIIEPGAFKKTIAERVSKRYIKLLDNHNSFSTGDVWGTVVDAEEVKVNAKGDNAPTHKLLTTFEVSQADPNAQIALQKVAERHLDQLSIGYRALKQEFEVDEDSGNEDDPYWAWVMGEGVRRIKEIQWWETSLVIWAMNPEAQILANSVDSLMRFAQKAAQAGVEVPPDAVRDTIQALQALTGERVPVVGDPGDDVRKAVSDVRGVLKTLEEAQVPADAVDRLNDLARDFYKEHGDAEVGASHFVSWAVDNLEDPSDPEHVEDAEKAEAADTKDDDDDVDTTMAEEGGGVVEPTEEDMKDADTEEVEEKDPANDDTPLAVAIAKLDEVMDKLAALGAGALGAEEDSPDEAASVTDDHAEEEEDAKDTEPVEDGRDEHFPEGDALALELMDLEILEQGLRPSANETTQ